MDRNNYHFFPPLLYQVSAVFIEPSNISDPYCRMLQGKAGIRSHKGKLVSVVPETNTIETDEGILNQDYLVPAMGTDSNSRQQRFLYHNI